MVILDPCPSFQVAWLNQKCWYLKNGGVGWEQGCTSLEIALSTGCESCAFQTTFVWEVGGNGEARVTSIADVAGYDLIRCLSAHMAAGLLNTVLPPLFSEISNQATLKSPGFEGGNLYRPKPGMLFPNMSCTFVRIPRHNLVPFSALQINGLFFWSGGINLYTTRRLI